MFKKLLLVFFLSGIATAAAAAGLYFYVDRQVSLRLRNRESKIASAIFSAPLSILTEGPVRPLPRLRQDLLSRGYIEAAEAPTKPGEFFIQDERLTIYTKSFRDAFNIEHAASLMRYDGGSRKITAVDGTELDALMLEPAVLAALGSQETRAVKYKRLDEIPPVVQQAVIAVEDERFYSHSGIDLLGISRAMAANVRAGRIVQGGSTLTQQLAKNILFTPRKTLGRKVLEAFAALSLERRLSKDQILELYLNEVYLGQEGAVAIHGFGEAVRAFFRKNLEDITPAEAALLAGIIKAPSYYSPRRHHDRALKRRDIVLRKMLDLGYLKESEFTAAVQAETRVAPERRHEPLAPHFRHVLLQELSESISVDSAALQGLRINTGIDADLQQCASNAVQQGLKSLEANYPSLKRKKQPLEAALVAIEPYSGLIKAWVGGRDFGSNQFDHVSQGSRQIGSTVKPFVYLTALDKNLNDYRAASADSILPDRPMEFPLPGRKTWAPENFDHRFRGDVTLRYALENSLNVPAAYIGHRVGVQALTATLKKFQLADSVPHVPAITLGALDTNLFRLTAAYAALANGGMYVKPRLFISAVDRENNTLARTLLEEERIADENAVYVLTNVLQGVIERGTGRIVRRLGYEHPAAGKTGTSNDARDAWFVAFTPNLAAGVWVGFDDNSKMGLTGANAAAPIWTDFMKCAEAFVSPAGFIPPRGVVFVDIDIVRHTRADQYTPKSDIVREVFIRGTEPREAYRSVRERPEEFENIEPPVRRRRRSLWEILTGR